MKFHRWLINAFDRRLQADYGFDAALTPEEVETTIRQAEEFVRVAERALQTDPEGTH